MLAEVRSHRTSSAQRPVMALPHRRKTFQSTRFDNHLSSVDLPVADTTALGHVLRKQGKMAKHAPASSTEQRIGLRLKRCPGRNASALRECRMCAFPESGL
jgi:hypothetical protein